MEGGFVAVTQDGGVRLKVLRPGNSSSSSSSESDAQRPPHHARCLVHYKGTVDADGELFLDTRAEHSEPVTMVAGRVASPTQRGLSAALCMMGKGDIAEVKCTAAYGYGEKGNFSFPSVPPNADITYEVELLDWEDAQDHEDPKDYIFFEEKVEAAERRRLQGNELFRNGDPLAALGKYSMALSFLPEDLLFQLEGFHEEAAWDVKLPTLLNIAACHLQLLDFNAAIRCCNQALERDPKNVKALFRRGNAKKELGQADAASKDLEQALKLAPSDTAIRKSLLALRKEEKESRKATAAAFRGKLATDSRGAAAQSSEASTKKHGGNEADGTTPESRATTQHREDGVQLSGSTFNLLSGVFLWMWRCLMRLLVFWSPVEEAGEPRQ